MSACIHYVSIVGELIRKQVWREPAGIVLLRQVFSQAPGWFPLPPSPTSMTCPLTTRLLCRSRVVYLDHGEGRPPAASVHHCVSASLDHQNLTALPACGRGCPARAEEALWSWGPSSALGPVARGKLKRRRAAAPHMALCCQQPQKLGEGLCCQPLPPGQSQIPHTSECNPRDLTLQRLLGQRLPGLPEQAVRGVGM